MKYWLIITFLLIQHSYLAEELAVYATESIPYHYLDPETGKATGPDADYVAKLFQQANLPMRMEIINWKRALKSVETTPNSFIFPLTRTPAREDSYQWITAVRTIEFAIFGTRTLNEDPLSGKQEIYCVEGTYHCDVIERFNIPNSEIVSIVPDSGGKLIELAARGRIEFFISEVAKAELYIEALDQPRKEIFEVTTKRLDYSDYLATSLRTSKELVDMLQSVATQRQAER